MSRQAVSRNGAQQLKKTGASVRSLGEAQEKTCLGRQSPELGHNGKKNRDVSKVIKGDPRKDMSRQAVSRNGAQRPKKQGRQ
jgi:hypothetical protein